MVWWGRGGGRSSKIMLPHSGRYIQEWGGEQNMDAFEFKLISGVFFF